MWENIHPDIQAAVRPIVESGKFDDAIFAAFRHVEGEIQERISSKSIGQQLLDEAFDTSPSKIVISFDARDQAGIKALFLGALGNIRNDRGHIHIRPDGSETFFATRDMAIDLAIDPTGNICIPASKGHAIHVYNRSGELIRTILHGIDDSISDIMITRDGMIYLSFFHLGKLFKISSTLPNPQPELIAEGFRTPCGIAMDSKGRIYVANFQGNSIELIY